MGRVQRGRLWYSAHVKVRALSDKGVRMEGVRIDEKYGWRIISAEGSNVKSRLSCKGERGDSPLIPNLKACSA